MKYADVLKPILIFSAILICSALIGIPLYISVLKDPRFGHEFSVFLLIMIFWHFTTGLGIILKKRWGMWLFKIYLYVVHWQMHPTLFLCKLKSKFLIFETHFNRTALFKFSEKYLIGECFFHFFIYNTSDVPCTVTLIISFIC